jgi:hypothetical protein
MKTVKITITARMRDDLYDNHFKDLKDEILSGKFQRELKGEKEGMEDVKVTYEEL